MSHDSRLSESSNFAPQADPPLSHGTGGFAYEQSYQSGQFPTSKEMGGITVRNSVRIDHNRASQIEPGYLKGEFAVSRLPPQPGPLRRDVRRMRSLLPLEPEHDAESAPSMERFPRRDAGGSNAMEYAGDELPEW